MEYNQINILCMTHVSISHLFRECGVGIHASTTSLFLNSVVDLATYQQYWLVEFYSVLLTVAESCMLKAKHLTLSCLIIVFHAKSEEVLACRLFTQIRARDNLCSCSCGQPPCEQEPFLSRLSKVSMKKEMSGEWEKPLTSNQVQNARFSHD